jgi:hypothetical protein
VPRFSQRLGNDDLPFARYFYRFHCRTTSVRQKVRQKVRQ